MSGSVENVFFSARERIFASYFDASLLIFYLLCLQHFLSCFSCKFLFEKGSFCFCKILILRLKTVCVSVFWNCAGLLLQGSKLNFIEMATTNSSSKHPFQNAERKPLFQAPFKRPFLFCFVQQSLAFFKVYLEFIKAQGQAQCHFLLLKCSYCKNCRL